MTLTYKNTYGELKTIYPNPNNYYNFDYSYNGELPMGAYNISGKELHQWLEDKAIQIIDEIREL